MFSNCAKDEDIDPASEMEENIISLPTIIPTGEEDYLNLDSDYIFDQDRLHTFHLIVPQSHLDEINSDPAAEEYVEAALVFQGDTISPIGLRYKGSIGAFVNCLSGGDWANPSGSKTCTKLSMKVKINWNDSPYKFYGLNKLQFHSQNLDDSQMRERLGYWLFRQMGVPSPRSVHARLMINGEYGGLFALTEQIDGRFAKHHFNDGDGNVYKEVWPLASDGKPNSDTRFMSALKTNEDEDPSVQIIRDIADQLYSADDDELQSVLSESFNLIELLSYCVVDRTIRHDDGPFHWYCNGSNCSNHNYYWYENPTNEKLHLIAWDLDNAFENIISDANPVTPVADEWNETRNNCQPFSYGAFGFRQRSAACDRLFHALAENKTSFDQLKSAFIQGPFSEDRVNAKLDKWSELIRDATVEASETHNDAISISTWEAALNELREQVDYARKN